MPGATQLIEIDLKGGISHNDPPIELMRGGSIGLRTAANCVWQPRYTQALRPTTQALAFPVLPIIGDTYTFASDFPSHVLAYMPFAGNRQRNLIMVRTASSGNIAVWRLDVSGPALQTILLGTSTIASSQCGLPGVSAYWRQANLNVEARDLDGDSINDHAAVTTSQNGLLFFSHPACNRIYYIDNNGSEDTQSATTNVAGPNGDLTKWYIKSYTDTNTDTDESRRMDVGSVDPPAGASALIVHLDRLWMAHPSEAFGAATQAGRSTTLWYTDPFNWRMIRATNFITIEDQVRALATPSSGGIGVGGQAQLVIFGIDTISVLDGDPTQGNTFYRILANNVGVVSQSAVVETPYGIVFVATDGQVYLLPPGAQRLIPIGEPILDVIDYNDARKVSSTKPSVQLYWHSPYVYMMLGSVNRTYQFDLSKPDNPKWWGKHTSDYAQNTIGQTIPNNLDSINSNSSFFFTHQPDQFSNIMTKVFIDTRAVLYVVGLHSSFTTGLFNVPGHKLNLHRVHVYQMRSSTAHPITVTAHTVEGQTYTGVLYGHPISTIVDTVNARGLEYPRVLTYVFQGLTSDAFSITITGENATIDDYKELYIQKCFAEVSLHSANPKAW